MRDIAKKSDMSLGASYYHFRSKDDLVLAFYQTTADQARLDNQKLIAQSKRFQKRLESILEYKINQLQPYRQLVKILARNGADFSHPLSPFSKVSKPMRDDAIEMIEQAIEGSDFKCSKILKPYMPTIFWLYQMGILLFWANDSSKGQKKTHQLINLSLSLLIKLIKLSSGPLLSPLNKTLSQVAKIVISTFEDPLEKEERS